MTSDSRAQPSRRSFLVGGLGSLAGAAVLGACSTERSANPAPSSTADGGGDQKNGGGGADSGVLDVVFMSGTTIQRNWNPWSPTATTSGANYFYEPLVRINPFAGFEVEPWLASKWEWNANKTELTFTLRSDVTWSDGKPLSVDDVLYTFNAPAKMNKKGLALPEYTFDSADKVGADKVKVTWKKPNPTGLKALAGAIIVPEHVFTGQNLKKWTNPDPVGTGPWTLSNYSPQQVKLALRKDYWNGPFNGVTTVVWSIMANAQVGWAKIRSGQIDWGNMAWPDAKKNFISKGAGNKYYAYPAGGAAGLLFNCGSEPFDDVHLRRAFYAALDVKKILSLYNVGYIPTSPTGLAPGVWNSWMPPELKGKNHEQDVDLAKKELAASGWKVDGGKLVKGGKSVTPSLKTVATYPDWVAFTAGMHQNWQDVLGVDVKIAKVPSDQLSKQENDGDFQIVMDFIGGASDIVSCFNTGQAGLNGKDVVKEGKTATNNVMRFDDAKITALLDKMSTTLDDGELKKLGHDLQKQVVAACPWVPIGASVNFAELNGSHWTGLPEPSAASYVPIPSGGPNTTLAIKNFRPA